MATMQLQAPGTFDLKKPDEWPKWKKRFEQFRTASNLHTQDDARQVSTLLYCLGEEAGDVLDTTTLSNADKKEYKKVIEAYDEFFKKRRNVIFERARFNRRCQLPGESAEQYITALYNLIDSCEYGTLKDDLLRDRIVVGIADQALSERMQLNPDLTLEKAKTQIRQKEAVQSQRQQLHGSKGNPIDVGAIGSRRRRPQQPQTPQGGANRPPKKAVDRSKQPCMRCGKIHNTGDKCPARSAVCHKCRRKGHYEAQCRSKTIAGATLDTDDFSLDASSVTVGTVTGSKATCWNVDLVVQDNTPVSFKIDTGAEVTVISEKDYRSLEGTLYGPTRKALNTIGRTKLKLTKASTSKTTTEYVYVVRNLKVNLLGLPAVTALGLIARVDSTTLDTLDPKARYPSLFTGLGTMGEEYHIQLKEDAKPHALFAPRNVPIPLRGKVEEELRRMEKLGVITPVEDPTPWCAGMVVVPKSSGAVRICVDLKPLNESVLRERTLCLQWMTR